MSSAKPISPSARALVPPPHVWFISIASWVMMLVAPAYDVLGHVAMSNVVGLISGFVGLMALVLWFVWRSGYSFWLRHGVGLALLLAPVAFFTVFQIDQVSGDLIPKFRYRFGKAADQLLERPVAEATVGIDLKTESPFDFPGFLGPQRNSALDWPQFKLSRDWSTPPREVWRQKIGAGWAAFAVRNGYAVTLEQRDQDELVTCYEALTGRLVWSHGVQARHWNAMGAVGPRSTPTIDGGEVFALGAQGTLYCLDGATGRSRWTRNLFELLGISVAEAEASVSWGRSNSPLVTANLVVVPGAVHKSKGASLVAFDRATGEVRWQQGKEQVSYASPAIVTLGGREQIVMVNEGSVTGHNVDTGEQLWRFEWSGHSASDANTSQAHVVASDVLFISKGYSGGAALFRFTAAGPELAWGDARLLKTKCTNVCQFQGHVYGLSDGTLECVEISVGEQLTSGKRSWKNGRYGHGQVLRLNDLLLVQAEQGFVALVAASPERHEELGRFEALTGQTWNNPAVFGQTKDGKTSLYLLVRNAEEAACYELPLE